jgi:hypothetical protein
MRYSSRSAEEITIKGTALEIEAVEAMLTGHILVGNPEADAPLRTSRFHPPNLDPDPETVRHFPPKLPEFQTMLQTDWNEIEVVSGRYNQERLERYLAGLKDFEQGCISVYVHGLSGYGCKEGVLLWRMGVMSAIGFQQMRSPRGEDGKYWEVWYLPGAWAAEGQLKGKKLNEIIRFVAKECCPGSIDLVRQHMALTVD